MNDASGPDQSFEQSLEELEQVVRKLEDGQVGLAEALDCYERGVGLLKHCHRLLQAAEQRVRVLTGLDPEGRPLTEPLDRLAGETKASERRNENLAPRPTSTPRQDAEPGASWFGR